MATVTFNMSERRLGVLISGRGSNLQALIDAIREQRLDATIAIVISNVGSALGLERAREAGLETLVMPHKDWPTRDAYDRALADALLQRRVAVVCLAGFMRLVGRAFIDAFDGRVLNVHPSLLPAFPGVDAQQQAYEHGVKITGATVHFVTPDLDAGPIILQSAVPVLPDDSRDSLASRILIEEHRLYPEAVQLVLDGHYRLVGRRFLPTAN